jgi:hypothetical protein
MVSPPESIRSSASSLPYIVYLISFLVIIILSVELIPSDDGFGTHCQLGLPACGFLTVTGYPCPSCGLTTSFSHFVRGDWLDAIRTQPFGFVLFVTLLVMSVIAVYALAKKIPLSHFLDSVFFERLQVTLFFLFFLSWFYKIYSMGL